MRARISVWSLAVGLLAAGWGADARCQSFLEQLESRLGGAAATPTEGDPAPSPPFAGFVADNDPLGVVVLSVREGGPAARGGLMQGDIIVRADGRPIANLDDLAQVMRNKRVGDKLELRSLRQRKQVASTLLLAAKQVETLPIPPSPAASGETPVPPAARAPIPPAPDPLLPAAQRPSLGVTVLTVTNELRAGSGLAVRRGALITGVRAGSPAAAAGLTVGGVIVELDGQRIDTADDLIAALQKVRSGQRISLSLYEGASLIRRQVAMNSGVRFADPPAAAPPAADQAADPLRPPAGGGGLEGRLGERGRRPLLGALGRVLDDVIGSEPTSPPAELSRPPVPAIPATGGDDLQQILQRLDRLQESVDQLRERIQKLEAGAARPAAP